MTTLAAGIRMLIVEDHIALAKNLFEYFDQDHYILDFASDGLTALHLLTVNHYDVIVLDVMLPGISGFELCRRIRQDLACSTPVIMMTAKDQMQDKEEGFAQGTDDYLVKPFNLRELELRVQALTRRKHHQNTVLRAGKLSYDTGTLKVMMEGHPPLSLTGNAARILEELMRTYPSFVSYEQLQDKIWHQRETDLNTLRTHVYLLRKQLQQQFNQSFIKTVHGRGFRLIPNGEE